MKRFLIFSFFISLFVFIFAYVSGQTIDEKVPLSTKDENLMLKEKDNYLPTNYVPNSDIKKELPQPQFIFPTGGEILKEKVKIQIKITEAVGVEFYLRAPESLQGTYLGKGQKFFENWELELDTRTVPNGTYFLFAKIYSLYGAEPYQSSEVKVAIENVIERNIEQENQLKQEVILKETEVLQKESEINKVLEETKTELEKIVDQTTKDLEKTLPLEKTKEIQNQFQESLLEIIKNINAYQKTIESDVKVEKNIIPESEKNKLIEEKNTIQNQIVQKIISPIEEIKKEISQEEKLALEKEIKAILNETEIILREKIREKSEISPLTLLDSDGDNLSDWDEVRIGTDPFNPDTDSDGFLDGIEVETKYNPLKPGGADKIVFQDPRKFGKVSDRIKIEKAEIIQLKGEESGLKITGKGIPNSFMTLYIFSSPLVAMVKVDSSGNFEYVLDKPLSDGYHVVYVALNNNKGEIQEKSQSFVFLKSGDQIMRISEIQAGIPQGPIETLGRSFLILTVSLILFFLSFVFFIVGFLGKKKLQ